MRSLATTATKKTPPPTKPKPKRIRRWAKRPANPNDEFPNASLSVLDVHLILRELEIYEKSLAAFKDRASKTERRHVRGLIAKLYQVTWANT